MARFRRVSAFFVCVLAACSLLGRPAVSALKSDRDIREKSSKLENSPEQLWEKAQHAMDNKLYDPAVSLLKDYIAVKPEDHKGLLELARVCSWVDKYDDSIRYYDHYLSHNHYDIDADIERCLVMAWKGDYAQAESEARRILAVEPENVDMNLLLADILKQQGKWEEAERQHKWILKMDPDSDADFLMQDEEHGQYRQYEPPLTDAAALEWDFIHTGDNDEFLLFGSRLGFRLKTSQLSTLKPFVANMWLKDSNNSFVNGQGGGLEGAWQISDKVRFETEIGAIYYKKLKIKNGNNIRYKSALDWSAKFDLYYYPSPFLTFCGSLHTMLYGPIGQSVDALKGEVRSYMGGAQGYFEKGDLTAFAEIELSWLDMDDYSTRQVTTAMFYPKLRLMGYTGKFYIGYKMWYTGHSNPSPAEYEYWSPKNFHSHELMFRLDGPIGAMDFYFEAGGGTGYLNESASDVGTEYEQAGYRGWYPTWSSQLGVSGPLTENLEAGLESWFIFSKRRFDGDILKYLLWNVSLSVVYRW